METKNVLSGNTTDREIVITRLLNAPVELVWKAWTDSRHLIKWWGPNGFTNTFQEISIKPGGVWKFIMHGPNGVDYPNLIVFKEVVKPRLLSYSHGSGEPNDPGEFQVSVTFEAEGQQTRLSMRSIFASAEERDKVVKEYGAIEGGNQTLDHLEAELKIMS